MLMTSSVASPLADGGRLTSVGNKPKSFFRVPCHLSHIPLNWLGRSLALPLNVNADTTLQLVGASRKLAKVHRQRL